MNRSMSSSVRADQKAVQTAIVSAGIAWPLPCANALRSLSNITLDWTIICLAVWGVYRIGTLLTILAILVIANRQRALGNLLHEAAHQNLSTQRATNDWAAHIFLAPALFNDLRLYRTLHARHHAALGDSSRDPDYLPRVTHEGDRWSDVYLRVLLTPSIWLGSAFGHLAGKLLPRRQSLSILFWWVACESLLEAVAGTRLALLFFMLWMTARCTVFHAITTFREMTDHYGLKPGGIFQYTRDIPDRGLTSVFLHPHHNGYHLTHHLFPQIPYFYLPQAHEHLQQVAPFRKRAIVCDAYVSGKHASVNGWGDRSCLIAD